MTTENYKTVAEVAEKLGVTPAAVYKWIKAGRLEAFQFGDVYRIPAAALDHFVETSRVRPEAAAGGR